MTFNSVLRGGSGPGSSAGLDSNRLKSVLIVDEEAGIRRFLQRGLNKYFGLVEQVENVETADALRQRCHFDLIISDIRLPGKSGVDWLKELREQGSSVDFIFITADADLETAVQALRLGARDFLTKPLTMERVLNAINGCLKRTRPSLESGSSRNRIESLSKHGGLIGQSASFRQTRDIIKRIAPLPSTVLLEGESGTGKDLAARAIHGWSGRSGSFVPINCGGMTAELLESELFGHVKGAFTGATQAREGLFSYANGGTLFLDEIGEMPPSMQAHLLRVLEERRIRAVGANQETSVDVRVVAATNRNLEEEVQRGSFRKDLFFRLNVMSIRMPPLREHLEDVPLLAWHFTEQLAEEMGVSNPTLKECDLLTLADYDWPGNVRELKNVIERCLLLNSSPSECLQTQFDPAAENGSKEVTEEELPLAIVEKRHILRMLQFEGGNKSAAARRLGISRKTLERKVRAWGME